MLDVPAAPACSGESHPAERCRFQRRARRDEKLEDFVTRNVFGVWFVMRHLPAAGANIPTIMIAEKIWMRCWRYSTRMLRVRRVPISASEQQRLAQLPLEEQVSAFRNAACLMRRIGNL